MELVEILTEKPALASRLNMLKDFAKGVRSSEYHLTHACNLRCRGCWFFEFGFDKVTGSDVKDLSAWRQFVRAERERGVTLAILIGGEPSLCLDRIRIFVDEMPYVWLSTNGLKPIPVKGFEKLSIAVTLFGGGPLDDDLRGFRPGGKRIQGLFETALGHYRNDDRAFFVYALSPVGIDYIEQTIHKIAENGNRVLFNYYGDYSGAIGSHPNQDERALLDKALEIKAKYSDTVLSTPYYIQTLISGESHWARWGFEVCPSISADHPENRERLTNGNPVLPGFNAYAPDLKTINKCCTSGHCDHCRDSQAITSWLMVSMKRFMDSPAQLEIWLDIAESFWSQFCWSPYHLKQGIPDQEPCLAVVGSAGQS